MDVLELFPNTNNVPSKNPIIQSKITQKILSSMFTSFDFFNPPASNSSDVSESIESLEDTFHVDESSCYNL